MHSREKKQWIRDTITKTVNNRDNQEKLKLSNSVKSSTVLRKK